MANPVNDDELQLKKRARRRLVGAIVLVLLVVVFLPMVLDEERKPLPGNVVIQIPPLVPADKAFPPSTGAPPAVSPATSTAPPPAEQAVQNPPSAPDAGAASVPRTPDHGAPLPRPPEPAAKAVPEPAASAQPKIEAKTEAAPAKADAHHDSAAEAGGYVVQLGAFSNAANARALLDRLKQARIPGYVETLRTPGGTKTRVRAGPYATEAAALQDRDRMLALKLASGDLKVGRKGD